MQYETSLLPLVHYDAALDETFNEKTDYLEYIFNIYSHMYSLETESKIFEVKKETLRKLQKKKFFFVLVPYDNQGRVYLKNCYSSGKNLQLLGGSVRNEKTFTQAIHDYFIRIQSQPKELQPVMLLKHTFKSGGDSITQHGIAYCTRITDEEFIEKTSEAGDFYYLEDEVSSRVTTTTNKQVLLHFKQRFDQFETGFPDHEIDTNQTYKHRYKIHNKLVKRILLNDTIKKKKSVSKSYM